MHTMNTFQFNVPVVPLIYVIGMTQVSLNPRKQKEAIGNNGHSDRPRQTHSLDPSYACVQ